MANSNDEQLFGDWLGEDESSADAPPEQLEPTSEQICDAHADGLREATGPSHYFAAAYSSLSTSIGLPACFKFREDLLRDCGGPSDPIEIMLVEQLALANFHVGRLFTKSAMSPTAPLSIAFAEAATRLQAEFRRCSLALEDYREKQASRKSRSASITVKPDPSPKEKKQKRRRPPKKKTSTTKLTSNGHTEVPEWFKDRMQPPTQNGSPLAASTGSNGRA